MTINLLIDRCSHGVASKWSWNFSPFQFLTKVALQDYN